MPVTRRLEIEALILVLLNVLRAGVKIMMLNGRFWAIQVGEGVWRQLGLAGAN